MNRLSKIGGSTPWVMLAAVVLLVVAVASGCASTRCHWALRVRWECKPNPVTGDMDCQLIKEVKWVCDTTPEEPKEPGGPKNPKDPKDSRKPQSVGVWGLPISLDWIREVSWSIVDRQVEVLPEDVRINLHSNVPTTRLAAAALSWVLVDGDGVTLEEGEVPLRVLLADGERQVLVPRDGPEFAEAVRRIAERVADDPVNVRLDRVRLSIPFPGEEEMEDTRLDELTLDVLGFRVVDVR